MAVQCAICDVKPTDKPLVIDHNHRTGQVRGLLCHECNTGLGLLGDSPALLTKAAQYLEENSYYGVFPRLPSEVRSRKG